MTTPHPVYVKARAGRDSDGIFWLPAPDVAKLIRSALKAAHPAVKFSVRTSSYNCVNVGWTDGPSQPAVDSIIEPYSFGGFDGMIDLAYSSQNWLHPDGRIEFAATRGTAGSTGTVPAQFTDCPAPGAILVRSSVKYVFSNRRVTPEEWAPWLAWAAAVYGCHNPGAEWHDRRTLGGEYHTTVVYRYLADAWRNDRQAYPKPPKLFPTPEL